EPGTYIAGDKSITVGEGGVVTEIADVEAEEELSKEDLSAIGEATLKIAEKQKSIEERLTALEKQNVELKKENEGLSEKLSKVEKTPAGKSVFKLNADTPEIKTDRLNKILHPNQN